MIILAPLAVLTALAATPAQARTDAGPAAYLIKGPAPRVLPAPVADALHPVVSMRASTVAGVFSTAQGTASVGRTAGGGQNAVAQLGQGAIKAAGLDMTFSRLAAQCATASDGAVRGVTTITGGVLLRRAAAGAGPALPINPPPNFRVPGTDPGVIVMVNKQIRDPLGGVSVAAVSVTAAPGVTSIQPREFAVARCGGAARIAGRASVAQGVTRANGVTGGLTNQAGGLSAQVSGVSGLFGGLPGLAGEIPAGALPE
jgi:hypothetical protein